MKKKIVVSGLLLLTLTGCAKSYDCSSPDVLDALRGMFNPEPRSQLSPELPSEMTKYMPSPAQIKITDIKTVEHSWNQPYTCSAKMTLTFAKEVRLTKKWEDMFKWYSGPDATQGIEYAGKAVNAKIGYTVSKKDEDGKVSIDGDDRMQALIKFALAVSP